MLSQQTKQAVASVCGDMADDDLAAAILRSMQTCAARLEADPEVAARKPYVGRRRPAPQVPLRRGPPSVAEALRWDEIIAHFDAAASDVASVPAIAALWTRTYACCFGMQDQALDYDQLVRAQLSSYEWREIFEAARSKLCRRPRHEGMQSIGETLGLLRAQPGLWRGQHAWDVVQKTIADLTRQAFNARDKRDRQRRALARWREMGELPSARLCAEMLRRRYIDPDEDVD